MQIRIILNETKKVKMQTLTKTGGGGSPAGCVEASGAGGFEPWEEPKTRALAATCFHRVTKVNQFALNFSMLPRGGARTMNMEREGEWIFNAPGAPLWDLGLLALYGAHPRPQG